MKRIILRLTALILITALTLPALAEPLPVYELPLSGTRVARYVSKTLRYDMRYLTVQGDACFLTHVWMADPGRQIRKATAVWEESLALPSDMARQVPEAALVINGSGYVSPQFPEIPDNYPGVSENYHYTPLGSLTITDGEIFRNLEGVPYYGLTLQSDGLHMHVGEDNEDVLANSPTQTWSFYEGCPMILDGESILDREWRFANRQAIRTIIAKIDQNNYILLTVTNQKSMGMKLTSCVDFLLRYFPLEWAYDLDGGPSSALLYRPKSSKQLKTKFGNKSKDADVMIFIELPQE